MTSGISARPKTLVQPKAPPGRGEQRGERGARVAGAGDAHRRALMLGGYQREASGSAAAKEAPATPRKRPRISVCS
jgi:hypothetical protein